MIEYGDLVQVSNECEHTSCRGMIGILTTIKDMEHSMSVEVYDIRNVEIREFVIRLNKDINIAYNDARARHICRNKDEIKLLAKKNKIREYLIKELMINKL